MANGQYRVISKREGRRVIGLYEHRLVWERAHGPIPPGHHIHHKDGDKRNNALANLECIPASEHHSEHMRVIAQSPEWKARASALGKSAPYSYSCTVCGVSFMSRPKKSERRFCGQKCKNTFSNGVRSEQRAARRAA